MSAPAWAALLAAWLLVSGCHRATPPGALVLSQTPLKATVAPTPDALDLRYPPGSRVVLAFPPFAGDVRLLSKGLLAAGEPIVAPDGRRVFFTGKAEAHSSWQIYQASEDGRPEAVTAMPGGAMNPAIIANGDLVFSSPVPKAGETWKTDRPAALHAKPISGLPRRLTFGAVAAVEATVLDDGRILFVSARPTTNRSAPPELGLFSINNDGTEFTAFALDRDGAPQVRRPRELPDHRVAFIAAARDRRASEARAEVVRTARPFASRAPLFSFSSGRCESVEPGTAGTLFACLETRGLSGRMMTGAFAVFRLGPDAAPPGAPVFFDPAWNNLDATPVLSRPRPMGHVSAMKPAAKFGTILCLDANFTRWGPADARSAKAEKIRVIAEVMAGETRVLGEVALLADGSFMAEVPPEIPLGFEALDTQGAVVRRLPPAVWVRPGENRSCIGCHQPDNRSPRNVRPLAASQPATRLEIPAAATRQASR